MCNCYMIVNWCDMTSKEKPLIFFLIIFNVSSWCYADVKMIQATIRHADRNPISGELAFLYYPNDPYKNWDYAPDGPMELTNAGKQNAYKLGKFLRDRYGTLIGLSYKPNRVYFHAAEMSRAINTAQLVAAGLFRPSDNQIWNPKLLWIPIPIHVTPMEEDILNYSLAFCENYLIDRLKADADVIRLLNAIGDIQKLFDYLSVNTGVNYTRSTQGWILYHQLAAQAGLGLKLESWTSTIFPDGKLVEISAIEYILQSYTERMKRLMGGIWIKTFLDHIDDLIIGRDDQCRGYFYASNEIQIAAILNALGVYTAHVPGYTSAVIFELHEISEEIYVKVIYRNEEMTIDFTIPGCENSICPLATFKHALENVTSSHYEDDCGNRIDFSIIKL